MLSNWRSPRERRGSNHALRLLIIIFYSTALTKAGWVRMTILSLGTVHQQLSSAAVIESRQEIFSIKNVRSQELNPGRRCEERERYLCAMPTPFSLGIF